MAADTEIIGIDNVEKSLWDKIVNIATTFSADELTALSALAEIKTALAELAEDKTALAALAENISGETLTALMEIISDGGSNTPFEMSATLGEDESHNQTLTLNKTASEVYEAASHGKLAKVTLEIPLQNDEVMTTTVILPCEAFKMVMGEQTGYVFKVRADSTAADKLFISEALTEDDPIVLTAVSDS